MYLKNIFPPYSWENRFNFVKLEQLGRSPTASKQFINSKSSLFLTFEISGGKISNVPFSDLYLSVPILLRSRLNNSKPSLVDSMYHGARGQNHSILGQWMQRESPSHPLPTMLPHPTSTNPRRGYNKNEIRQAPMERTKKRIQIIGPGGHILKQLFGKAHTL